MKSPLVVAYGGGVNSTAMLIQMSRIGQIPDLILFADTGGERPETYESVMAFDVWLQMHGMPGIITVRHESKKHGDKTLEEECLRTHSLPSIAYGYKKCSLKWKKQPQDKFINNWPVARECWKSGEKVTKAIGYDIGEMRRAGIPEDEKYVYVYPLIDWGWHRDRCEEVCRGEGIIVPKSSCFFCPSMKRHEIMALPDDLRARAVAMENNMDLTPRRFVTDDEDGTTVVVKYPTVVGLGRSWAWRDLYAADKAQGKLCLFGDERIEQDCGCYDG